MERIDDYHEINREGAARDKNDTDENSTKSFNLKNNDMSHHIFLKIFVPSKATPLPIWRPSFCISLHAKIYFIILFCDFYCEL